MSFADSKPVFQSRAAEIGLSNDDVKKLEEAGIVSMALFAFSCNYAPGGSDDKPFMEMIGRVLGDEPSMQQIACLRRLFAEAVPLQLRLNPRQRRQMTPRLRN